MSRTAHTDMVILGVVSFGFAALMLGIDFSTEFAYIGMASLVAWFASVALDIYYSRDSDHDPLGSES